MASPSPQPASSPPPRRRNLAFFGLVLLILAALPAGYFLFLRTPAPPPPPPPPPAPTVVEAPKPVQLRLAKVEGKVELRRKGGEWAPAAQDTVLSSEDAVRTADGSVAVLVGGEAWEVRMEPGTEVSVDSLTSTISRLLLQNGMATATVHGEAKHTFEVHAAGSDAVASTRDGQFAISNNGEGTVAVGARSGEVSLSGHGKVVIVRAGQQSIVRPGQGPSAPTAVPSSLLLKVKWPGRRVLNDRRVVIRGQAEPGAWVEVAGQVTRSDEQGHFQRAVRLREGHNVVQVRARSVGGHDAQTSDQVLVDTRGPSMTVDVPWKKKR